MYSRRRLAVPRLAFAQHALEHKLWFDEAYDLVFYRPSVALARFFGTAVEGFVVSGSIVGLGRGVRDAARGVAEAQTGLLRTYALAIAGGLAVLLVVFISVR
jgi:NADH-quinone oxidoreductase subunit L